MSQFMFLKTLEKGFNKLTGRKLDMSYLPSVFFSIGTAVAILAVSRNLAEARLLLRAIANRVDRKFDSNLTIFHPYQTPFWYSDLLELSLFHWKLLALLRVKYCWNLNYF